MTQVANSVQQVIVDAKGTLFVNKGAFAFIDPSTGVRFEPGVQVKVLQSAWMKGQPVIEQVEVTK